MGVYISSMELPSDENETIIRIQSDGTILDQYGHHLAITAISVPKFSDIGFDSDDVWKKIFTLVVLLLSDREKFDKLKDDMLTDLEGTK